MLAVVLCAVVLGYMGTVGRCGGVAWCWDTSTVLVACGGPVK